MNTLTITLHSYRAFDPKTNITYANHNVVMAGCESSTPHRMDTGRCVAHASDALTNLKKYVDEFVSDLKSRVYDDVIFDEIIVIDKLQRDLPHRA